MQHKGAHPDHDHARDHNQQQRHTAPESQNVVPVPIARLADAFRFMALDDVPENYQTKDIAL
jgi:hypothetical protein